MGKKSKTAGTTKTRTRTCDKPEHRTNLDKFVLNWGKKIGFKSGKMFQGARRHASKRMDDETWVKAQEELERIEQTSGGVDFTTWYLSQKKGCGMPKDTLII